MTSSTRNSAKPSMRSMRPRRSKSDLLSVRFYYGAGSPYAWRVWLALEHKGIPYHRKTLSFDACD
jgi:Glutathione S-transferase, N-terminal domain